MLGDDLARPQLATLATARHVEGFERLMRAMSSQGGSSFSQQHREQPDTKPSDEEWGAMSFADRRIFTTTGKRPA